MLLTKLTMKHRIVIFPYGMVRRKLIVISKHQVYLMRGSQCPSMLKDLLLTSELGDIFGESAVSNLYFEIHL